MRLFTALDLPAAMLTGFEQLLTLLRSQASIKWSPLHNLHITTKFIGTWPEERLDELDSALKEIPFPKPFEIKVGNLGWFPNARSPRVLWAGVDGGPALPELAAATEDAMAALGLPRDPHPFSPHLTLARIRSAIPLQRLRAKVEELQSEPIGQFSATACHLYRSDPGPDSSIYQKLRSYPFHP